MCERVTIMNKWLILILVVACGLIFGTSLVSAACSSCHGHDEKDHEEVTDPCACICPFEESGHCTPIPGIDTGTGETVISDPTGTVKANFVADITTGDAPLTVHFHDTSTGDPNVWTWDFDDGTNSALRDPTHTFPMPGNYTITFMAKKYTKEGTKETIVSARIIKPDYIVVTGQPSLSGASGAAETTPVVSSPSQSVVKTPRIIQPVIENQPAYTMYGGYVVLPLYYGNSNPVSPFTVYAPVTTTYATAGSGIQYGGGVQPEPRSVSYISVNPVSIPINFLLGYSLSGMDGQGS
jgi:hypothetical protein